jgi:teichoic acid transport system permease protein
LLTGEPLTWYWLMAIPALLLQTIFNVGVGLFVARLGSQVNDFSQLLPFLLRTWMYVSGVLFNIATLNIKERWAVTLLQLNPAALYITLVRNALLETQRRSAPGSAAFNPQLCNVWKTVGHRPHPTSASLYDSAHCAFVANPDHFWYYAIGWAVAAFIIGFVFFWRSEAKYGRG